MKASELVEKILQAEIMDGLDSWTPTSGAPQGAIISLLLSILYLNELDHLMASVGYQMTRYAGDSVSNSGRSRSGVGHGADHQRYRNACCAELGLFSMTIAHACECQSCHK